MTMTARTVVLELQLRHFKNYAVILIETLVI